MTAPGRERGAAPMAAELAAAARRLASSHVLVTGGTGFVGSALVRRLAGIAREVRVLALPDDPSAAGLERAGGAIHLVRGDVGARDTLDAACDAIELVYHCAAVVTDWAPRRLFDAVNVQGTTNVLGAAAAAGVARLVHLSTNDVFGLVEGRVIDETFDMVPWGEPYPDTKIAAEGACWAAHRAGRIPVSMVYPCWIYGPGDRRFVPEIAHALRTRQLVLWRRDCLVWPLHVENLVDLLLLVGTKPEAAGEGYLAHDGMSLTFEAFCHRIAAAIGAPPPPLAIPRAAAHLAALAMEAAARALRRRGRPLLTTYVVKNLGARLEFSIAKARRLGFVPRIAFDTGLREALDGL